MQIPALLTDLYQLTMLAGYLREGWRSARRSSISSSAKPLPWQLRGLRRAAAGPRLPGGTAVHLGPSWPISTASACSRPTSSIFCATSASAAG